MSVSGLKIKRNVEKMSDGVTYAYNASMRASVSGLMVLLVLWIFH